MKIAIGWVMGSIAAVVFSLTAGAGNALLCFLVGVVLGGLGLMLGAIWELKTR